MEIQLPHFESIFKNEITKIATAEDPAHDLLHFQRVVKLAKHLCHEEMAKIEVVMPAAWLHDLVIVPKNDPRRSLASRLSADAAKVLLVQVGYPESLHEQIAHAVEAHSFSANITCRTIEAEIVQDADRLDGLGAIGIARCFATSGLLKRAFYQEPDPFCQTRAPEDTKYTIDHFYQKLYKTVDTLKTSAGKKEGQRRAQVMRAFLDNLKEEISA